MDELKIESTYKPHLRSQFSNGSLVLFTGAGFSLDGKNITGENLPSAYELTKLIWELCYPTDDFEDDTQLQDIFDDAKKKHNSALGDLLKSKFTVNGETCPNWYRQLIAMPWLRAYTLNIDDLVEKVSDFVPNIRPANTISATSGSPENLTENKFDIIHLNGSIDDVPNDVTFSRFQYAERVDEDPFYRILNSDLLTRPFIFIGSSLEEGMLWEHLVARGSKGGRTASELRPRSYLVIPHLNKSKLSMLADFNIVWLKMTGEEFFNQILNDLDDVKPSGFKALKDRGLVGSVNQENIGLVNDLAQVKVAESEYLLGAEPIWSDVQNERMAQRQCFEELWSHANKIRAMGNKNEFLVVTGTAGVGKSSALMWLALKLQSDGMTVAWMDQEVKFVRRDFVNALNNMTGVDALIINDADVYGSQLSSFLRLAIERHPTLLIVIEARSNKIDKIIKPYELGVKFTATEYTIPHLCDDDIGKIIEVLDKENRLGKLKGMTDYQREVEFKKNAGRQLLVAMYEATSGLLFVNRATDELSGLDGDSKFIYGLVSAASAYRFSLTRDEIVIACGDSTNESLNTIENLINRKMIHKASGPAGFLKARHRVIANIIYTELVESGAFERMLKGLLLIGVAKVGANSPRNSRHSRMLRTFINHNFMKRAVDVNVAKNIYGEFESFLSWDSHYWLHRGALELESNELGLAENFLNQAMSLHAEDPFIQNEWAYLLFKKAISNPASPDSKELVNEAITLLEAIIARSVEQSAHAYHVLGQQGLNWVEQVSLSDGELTEFLEMLKRKISEAVKIHSNDGHLIELEKNITRKLLSVAIR